MQYHSIIRHIQSTLLEAVKYGGGGGPYGFSGPSRFFSSNLVKEPKGDI